MAEAQKKPAPATPEKPGDAAAAPKAKKDWLGLGLLMLVLMNVLSAAGLGFFLQKLWHRLNDLDAQTQKIAESRRELATERTAGEELKPQPMGTLFSMESFLVNVMSDQGPKFLQTQMEFELADPTVEDEIVRKKPAIRDAIIVLLSSKTYRDLRDPKGMKILRNDLIRSINGMLASGKIKDIYFTQFHFN